MAGIQWLTCQAPHPDPKRPGDRHGRRLMTVPADWRVRSTRVLPALEDVDGDSGCFGLPCSHKQCGMVTEFELLAPAETPPVVDITPRRRRVLRPDIVAERKAAA